MGEGSEVIEDLVVHSVEVMDEFATHDVDKADVGTVDDDRVGPGIFFSNYDEGPGGDLTAGW